jgi:hypothetical protein
MTTDDPTATAGVAPRRVQRQRTKGWRMPANTVYVGRPTKWGNPYRVGNGYVAEDIVALYWAWMVNTYNSTTMPRKPDPTELRGKDLACWCPLDRPCHADVLLELANGRP